LLTRYLRKVVSTKSNGKAFKRKPQILEIYSERYFKSNIQDLVNQEVKDDPHYASLPRKEQQARRLSTYLRIRADCWDNESDEVKAEIQKIYDETHGKGDQGDEENADEDESETKEDDEDDTNDEKTILRHQQK
jgi:hypothetical protein